MTRSRPNILVIGTPGTGKSTICQLFCEKTGLNNITLSEVIKNEKFYKEWDDDYNAAIFDEDRTGDWLDETLADGGNVVEFHSCEWMDPSWFDIVVVLRTDNGVLYDRLEKRGYPDAKIQENVQCEIFMMCKEEAYDLMEDNNAQHCILELENNTFEQVEANVNAIGQFVISKGFTVSQ